MTVFSTHALVLRLCLVLIGTLCLTACAVDGVREQFSIGPVTEVSSQIIAVHALTEDQLSNAIRLPTVSMVTDTGRTLIQRQPAVALRQPAVLNSLSTTLYQHSVTYEECALSAEGDPLKLHYCIREELMRQNDQVRMLAGSIELALAETESRLQIVPPGGRFNQTRLSLNAVRSQVASATLSSSVTDRALINFRYITDDATYNLQNDMYKRIYVDIYYRILKDIQASRKRALAAATSFNATRRNLIGEVCGLRSAQGPVFVSKAAARTERQDMEVSFSRSELIRSLNGEPDMDVRISLIALRAENSRDLSPRAPVLSYKVQGVTKSVQLPVWPTSTSTRWFSQQIDDWIPIHESFDIRVDDSSKNRDTSVYGIMEVLVGVIGVDASAVAQCMRSSSR